MKVLLKTGLEKILFNTLLLSALLFSGITFAQMSRFPYQNPDSSYNSSLILTAPNNDLLFYWAMKNNIFQARSTDNGISWSEPLLLTSFKGFPVEIFGLTSSSGKIFIVYSNNSGGYYSYIYSWDGIKWSLPQSLPSGSGILESYRARGATLSQSSSGKLFFVYSRINTGLINDIYFITSSDNGATWSSENTFISGPAYGSVSSPGTNKLIMVYPNHGIFSSFSSDDGVSWSPSAPVISNDTSVYAPRIVNDQSGKLWLFYLKNSPTPFSGLFQKDIIYQISSDSGLTWGTPINFTKYKGADDYFDISIKGNNPLVSFSSDRFDSSKSHNYIWYGTAGITQDNNPPPYYYKSDVSVNPPPEHQPFNIDAYVDCANNISSVTLNRIINYVPQSPIKMYDDGTHGDSVANDKIYTCIVPGIILGDVMQTSITITDQYMNSGNYQGPIVGIPLINSRDSIMIDVNRFNLPVNNIGTLGDQLINGQRMPGGNYDGNIVMYSGGFYLSGLSNGFLWANGSFTAGVIGDYVPGKVGSFPRDTKNILYVVRSGDPPFSQSWQNWKVAVSQGASFYDGNHDGIYNPVDLNGNGKWDPNEDRPDILGDITAWCVYNDGVPAVNRAFSDVNPQGIDIQQTNFAQKDSADLNNVVFVRYRIINRGTVADVIDSVYFGAVNDVDIGDDGMDDLDGCDTLLNTAYTYHDQNNISTKWGPNPPAEFTTLVQGPVSYIPGITFTDVNGNGVYDPAIDIPLDTAFSFNGPLLGKLIYPGAKNLDMSSANQYFKNNSPQDRIRARYVLTGKYIQDGNYFNPCSWTAGQVLGGINCSAVNPLFLYSGDPLTQSGWINTLPLDQRSLLSTGPFRLEKNKPVDIIIAEIVGRGNDALNSITVAENYASNIIKYCNSNFPNSILTGIRAISYIPNNFRLDQNYPNPFNPSTKIRFSVKTNTLITIKVYNILGKEVAVPLNETKLPGEYSLDFNAGNFNLASGVYFYRMTSGSFNSVKKMILLK